MRIPGWLLAVALVSACADDEPKLPPLELSPKLPELQRAAAAVPAPPADAEQRQLRDLVETAFVPGLADERLAASARENLLESPHARWALEQALEHAEPSVRNFAAFELGKLGQWAALPVLVKRLKYELEPEPLAWVADALDMLGNRAGFDKLIELIQGGTHAEIAGQRAIAILQRAHVLDPSESPSWDRLLEELRQLLRRWRSDGAPQTQTEPLPQDLAELDARIAERLVLLEGFQLRPVDDSRFILARLGRLAVPHLVTALHASEPFLRNHALEVLLQLGPVARNLARNPTLALLQDPLARANAVAALGAMQISDAFPFVAPLLASPDPELRVATAAALGPLGNEAAIPLLEQKMLAADESMDVRVRAAFSLAVFELDRPGLAFLRERRRIGDYHQPTIDELLIRIDERAAR